MTEETPGQMLDRLGMDGVKWAAEFRKTAMQLGYSDMDEGWLIGWFANAIMAGYDRAPRADLTPSPEVVKQLVEALRTTRDRLLSVLHSEFDGVWSEQDFLDEVKEADAALAKLEAWE